MDFAPPKLTTQKLVRAGFRDLLKPPFRTLLALSLFLTLASDSFGSQIDNTAAFLALALLIVSAYLEIAVMLAAAEASPNGSADTWIKNAVKARCFWRFSFAGLIAILLIAGGMFLLIVPGLILCGLLSLVQPAVVLERCGPVEALRRSATVSLSARRPLAAVFFLFVLMPNLSLQIAQSLSGTQSLSAPWVALDLVTVVLYTGGAIALARAFVALRPPPPQPL
jgi:hypothetical protein